MRRCESTPDYSAHRQRDGLRERIRWSRTLGAVRCSSQQEEDPSVVYAPCVHQHSHLRSVAWFSTAMSRESRRTSQLNSSPSSVVDVTELKSTYSISAMGNASTFRMITGTVVNAGALQILRLRRDGATATRVFGIDRKQCTEGSSCVNGVCTGGPSGCPADQW